MRPTPRAPARRCSAARSNLALCFRRPTATEPSSPAWAKTRSCDVGGHVGSVVAGMHDLPHRHDFMITKLLGKRHGHTLRIPALQSNSTSCRRHQRGVQFVAQPALLQTVSVRQPKAHSSATAQRRRARHAADKRRDQRVQREVRRMLQPPCAPAHAYASRATVLRVPGCRDWRCHDWHGSAWPGLASLAGLAWLV